MNYQDMSDFEINTIVSETLGLNWFCAAGDSPTGGWEYCCIDALMMKDHSRLKDYCNNASDAWPILLENKIGFKFVNGVCVASSVLRGYHESISDNPLRASMIVFLIMQESK